MKILVIGAGAREHAIICKIAADRKNARIFCAPGNPGIATLAECVDIPSYDIVALVAWAKKQGIYLTIVGPENPLAEGIVDEFARAGLRIFGPSKRAAQLESSKAYSKQFMTRHNIPTARYQVFTDYDLACACLNKYDYPLVLKADGLAAGKGVVIAYSRADAEKCLREILIDEVFGTAGKTVLIEEFLQGKEVSLLAFSDGKTMRTMQTARDYKRAYDNDEGPNTGGMGAVSPAPGVTAALLDDIHCAIVMPTLQGLIADGIDYRGVLYFGLMLTDKGPKVLEYNCRFGDPETEVLLPRLQSDLLDIMLAVCAGTLSYCDIRWSEEVAVCVVLASRGYPGEFDKGYTITGIDKVVPAVRAYHASTKNVGGCISNAGGRVLVLSATGKNCESARSLVYQEVSKISWEGMHYRSDIAG